MILSVVFLIEQKIFVFFFFFRQLYLAIRTYCFDFISSSLYLSKYTYIPKVNQSPNKSKYMQVIYIYIYIYIQSSTDRLFRCITTPQCGQRRGTLEAGNETRLTLLLQQQQQRSFCLHFIPYRIPECSIRSKSFALCKRQSKIPSPECSTPMGEREYSEYFVSQLLFRQVRLKTTEISFSLILFYSIFYSCYFFGFFFFFWIKIQLTEELPQLLLPSAFEHTHTNNTRIILSSNNKDAYK